MIELPFVVLHVGHGVEMTMLGYLYRVLLTLVAIGEIVVLVFWGSNVIEVVRSVFVAERGRYEDEQ